ncbi:hypothetical protein PRIPAC_96571 [Pristionchus pacificus]|uniref:Uncharacterized protein n=1 Tax=Pristionchus pacificus TaxID=54126 RepID=A0A2A6CH75_PRIPA|nr:hypothetical protein PRIPAC_96571 [Pristionchus pacificus]|eukprot:PDM77446.1 hypothetical protein PRIPAC_33176 [Pristionchus pacificus]
MHHLYPLGIFPPSCMVQQQSAGTPAVRFGVGSQLQQFGVAPVEDSGFAPAGRIATGSVRSMQLLSYRSQDLPAPIHPPRDATNTVADTDDNARSQAHSEDVDDDGSSFTTTPPCSPSPRSSRELSSEPSTPLYLPHLQSSQGDGKLIAVVRSTSSSPNEDYVVESSDEDEEDDPPPRSPRGPPSPTPPPPPPPPAAKIFCRGMTRKEYSQAYYQLNKDRIREYNGEYYRINRERILAEAKEKHEARRGKEKLGKVQHDQGNNELLNLPGNELSK